MKRLKLSVLLLSAMPAAADPAQIQCPGQNTVAMRWCASKQWEESTEALQKKLSPEALGRWRRATKIACAEAYAPVRSGTIYPQMIIGCDDRLNRTLLKEFTRLGE